MSLFLGMCLFWGSNHAMAADGGNLKPHGILLSSTLPDHSKVPEKKIKKSEKKLNKNSGAKYNDLRLVLGSAYFVHYQNVYYEEMERFQEEYDSCFSTPECDVATKDVDTKQSQQHLNQALKMYVDFVEHAANEDSVDLALMYIADIYERQRDIPNALDTYKRLLDAFPNSEWTVEACLKSANLTCSQEKFLVGQAELRPPNLQT